MQIDKGHVRDVLIAVALGLAVLLMWPHFAHANDHDFDDPDDFPTPASTPGAIPSPGGEVPYPAVSPCSTLWGIGYSCAKPTLTYAMPTPSASPAPGRIGPQIGGLTGD